MGESFWHKVKYESLRSLDSVLACEDENEIDEKYWGTRTRC